MRYKNIMTLTIILAALLTVSAVSASEDIVNQTVSSDIDYQINPCDDVFCQSVDDQYVLKEVTSNSKDNQLSFDDDTWWGYDYVEWYEGDEELVYPSLDALSLPESHDDNNITFKLTKDDTPLVNVDLAIITDYDYEITKLTTDSNGIAVYNIPFEDDFNFLAGFWYDEDCISNYMKYNGSILCMGAVFEDEIIYPSDDGEWDSNVIQAKLEVVKVPVNPGENVVTLKLTNLKDGSPIGNVEIGVKTTYDYNIYNIGATDSKGMISYHHPLETGNYSLIFGLWDVDGISAPTKTMDYDLVFLDISILKPEGNYSGDHGETNDPSNGTDSENAAGILDNGTFTELQNLVTGAPIGSIIYLENDYHVEKEFYEGYGRYFDGIIISKSLTIDGKGHTITGNGERGTVNIFTISADVPVTIKNMILANGSRAITSVSNLNIINCTFINNVKLGEGGAIYCDGKLTVANSNFTENAAFYVGEANWISGGAIICGKESIIFNSTFENNSANRGSAVFGFSSGDVTLTDCTFYKNYGWDNGRLLVDNYIIFNANAINCRFMGYKSSDNIVRGNIQNCIFTGDSILSTKDVTKFYGSSDKFYIDLVDSLGNGIANVDVGVNIGGNASTVKTDSMGHASVDLDLGVGSYEVVSSYNGISTTSKVTVKSTITTNDATGTYSNAKATTTFLGTDGKTLASRQVTFKVGDKTYTATTNANGVATANIPLGVGTYTVTAVNPVNSEQKTFKLFISKAKSTISLTSSQSNGVTTLTATFTPETATGNVVFNVNGEDKSAPIKNGKATFTLADLNPGDYVVTASYNGDKNLNASNSSAVTFNVADVYPILTANPVTKTYGTSTKLLVNLKDSKGNAIANADVNVVIGSDVKNIKTNSEGKATLDITKAPGTYTATITYADAKTTAKITVKKATPKLTAKAKTFKKSVKTKKYTVTLKTNQNKVMKNTKVTLKVNGKTYSAKTNSKGVATFKLIKLTKKGKFTAVVKYAGSKYYNAKTVKPKITVK